LNLFYQFAFAGIVQLIFAFAFTKNYDFEKWSAEFCLRGLFGCFRFGDYLLCVSYALKRVNPSQISMLNYVNTIIAIFLGWLILDEKITTKFILRLFLLFLESLL
jgi:drug/metabolite transporter (DMT)-like permease